MRLEKGGISIYVSGEGTTIEIKDGNAATTFCKVHLTPEQLSLALSRLSNTPCSIEVGGLDRVGKTHENENFTFEIPKDLRSSSKTRELTILCNKALRDRNMTEWITDGYFSSQNTFSEKDGKIYASTTIRRWI